MNTIDFLLLLTFVYCLLFLLKININKFISLVLSSLYIIFLNLKGLDNQTSLFFLIGLIVITFTEREYEKIEKNNVEHMGFIIAIWGLFFTFSYLFLNNYNNEVHFVLNETENYSADFEIYSLVVLLLLGKRRPSV